MSKQLDDMISKKIEELDQMSINDEGFKESAQAVSTLVDAQTKSDSKESVWAKVGKWSLAALAAVSPFVLNAMSQRKDDERLDKILEYEKTGCVMATGSKSVLSSILKFKK
jgi:hypothetical protein